MVYTNLILEASTKSSPPNLMRHVLVEVGVNVEAEVGYARTCCLRSTTLVLAGGNTNDNASISGASPAVLISDSSELMLYT